VSARASLRTKVSFFSRSQTPADFVSQVKSPFPHLISIPTISSESSNPPNPSLPNLHFSAYQSDVHHVDSHDIVTGVMTKGVGEDLKAVCDISITFLNFSLL
jgi:hypothetical protein